MFKSRKQKALDTAVSEFNSHVARIVAMTDAEFARLLDNVIALPLTPVNIATQEVVRHAARIRYAA